VSFLWQLVLDASEAVSAEARSLLVAVHTQLGGSIADHGPAIQAAFLRCGLQLPRARTLVATGGYMKSMNV
jgi:hypothetical protein